MFDIQSGKFGRFTLYTLINTQSGEYISVVPEYGANVINMVLKGKDILLPVLAGYKSWNELQDLSGYKSCRLMPFPNRIAAGRYVFNEKEYQLPINRAKESNAIHGLFYNSVFAVDKVVAGPKSAQLAMHLDYDAQIEGYPFPLRCDLELTLNEGGLTSVLKVTNTGKGKMPFGDGWHPYFSFGKGVGSVNDLYLRIPASELLELNKDKVPTGTTLPCNMFETSTKISDTELDIGLHLDEEGKIVTELYDPSTDVTLGLWQIAGNWGYNYLQIYTPQTRDSIALEPMTCAPNAFNNGMGLIVLEPGDRFTGRFGVYLD